MRVNFILPGLGDSGGMRVVEEYARLMNENGVDVKIYCSLIADNLHRYSSETKNIIHQAYCTVKTILTRKSKNNVVWVPLIKGKYIRAADHTIATMWSTAYNVAKLPTRCGKKWYFVQGFEIWDNEKLGLNSYQLPLNKIVVSTWINEQLKKNLGIGPFPVVYNGINRAVFKPGDNKERKQHLTVLMLNHDNPVKGIDLGLKVLERIKKKYPLTKFVMFGMRDRNNLPTWIEYYQDPDQSTLIQLYQNTDIFIFPSLQDGWGLTPVEAMACGCAVVGTNTGFTLDIGKHRENMMISEPGDIERMTNNVINLIEDVELLDAIRDNAVRTTEQLDWGNSARMLTKLLK